MPEVYSVTDVQAAVDMAYRFRDEGKYDWFRGQKIDRPPHSTLFREIQGGRVVNAGFRYERFTDWLQRTKELKHLLEPDNVHQLEAVMQHYGIPTHYIDFTTDPGIAGFFAADTNEPPPADKFSCIYCLDTKDLLRFWEVISVVESREGAIMETVHIDVENLWRLQAQKGLFLHCNYGFHMDYDLDKIIFPYTGYPSYPTKDIIYPDHKSALEQLLDEYFDLEKALLVRQEMKGMFEVTRWKSFPNGVYADAFHDPLRLIPLQTWEKEIESWLSYKVENFHSTTGTGQKLRLGKQNSAKDIRDKVSFGIKQLIRSNDAIRNQAINWSFEDVPTDFDSAKASELIRKVWNGVRLLPYDADDVGEACGNTLYLYLKSNEFIFDRDRQLSIFSEAFGQSVRVGFTNEGQAGSFGYVSIQSLNDAMEINLKELLKDEYKDVGSGFPEIFKVIYNPRLTFDFDKFRKFFAREIIPSQVAFNQRLLIFNPQKLIIFGIP